MRKPPIEKCPTCRQPMYLAVNPTLHYKKLHDCAGPPVRVPRKPRARPTK